MKDKLSIKIIQSTQGFANLVFSGRPTDAMLEDMKAEGWRYSYNNNCWYPSKNAQGKDKEFAEKFLEKYYPQPELKTYHTLKEEKSTVQTQKDFNNELFEQQNVIGQEATYRYRLLSRMVSDCEYYIGNGNRAEKHLWSGDEVHHIKNMVSLYNSFSFEDKPEWLTIERLDTYSKELTGKSLEENGWKKSIVENNVFQDLPIPERNADSYTNEILDKIRAAGIEVVTDKDEFDRILEEKQKLQKMSVPFAKLNIGIVEDWQIQEAEENGIDIRGYKHQITNEFIAHVIKNHGNTITEKMRGNIAITETDLKAIRNLITSPDRIVYGTKFKDLVSNKMVDRDIIIYAKNMPDGTSLYFEEILYGKKNTSLRAKTLYKKDKLISDEALLNIIGSNASRMNTNNSKIIAHEGVAVSPLVQHNNTGAVAVSATHEQLNNDISNFVDKSITNYVNSKIQTYTVNSQTYGFVHNGKIYLNPEIMNSNAAVHEYTHLWDAYTQKTNPELWNKGLEIFKDTKYWKEVISDPNYQDIKDDENLVLSEIHARIQSNISG